jgi:hypothetical protein
MLPVIRPYEKAITYAGEPLQEYSALLQDVAANFDKIKAETQALDVVFNNIEVSEGDKALINPILDGYRSTLSSLVKDAKGNVRYDLAKNTVEKLAVDFAKNKYISKAIANNTLIQQDLDLIKNPQFKDLYYGDTEAIKKFRTVNPNDSTTNSYVSPLEKKLDANAEAVNLLKMVNEDFINGITGLTPEEKALIGTGSDAMYKFFTTVKKDSDTFKKVMPHLLKAAENSPALQQYGRYNNGVAGIQDLLTNVGMIGQSSQIKESISNAPTVAKVEENTAATERAKLYQSISIRPQGTVSIIGGMDLFPEREEDYSTNKGLFDTLPAAPTGVGGFYHLSGSTSSGKRSDLNKKNIEAIKLIRNTNPKETENLTDVQVAKWANQNRAAVNNTIQKLFGNTDLVLEITAPLKEQGYIKMQGNTITSSSRDVYVLNRDVNDKKALGDQVKDVNRNFNWESYESIFMGVHLPQKEDKSSGTAGGFVYLLKDKDGNSVEVVKHNHQLNQQFEPISGLMSDLNKLVRSSSKTKLAEGVITTENTKKEIDSSKVDKKDIITKQIFDRTTKPVTTPEYRTISTSEGGLKVRPIAGNLSLYKDGVIRSAIPNLGEGLSSVFEVIYPNGNITYLTPEQFQSNVLQNMMANSRLILDSVKLD